MSESKRGVVMLIQAGDPEITEAIAEGIMAARGTDTSSGADAPPSPQGEGFGRAETLTREQIETVEAEMDRMSILEGLRAQAQGKAQDAPETRAQGDSRRAWGAQEIERAMLRVAVGEKLRTDRAMLDRIAGTFGENAMGGGA